MIAILSHIYQLAECESEGMSIPSCAARRGSGLIGRDAIASMRIDEPEMLPESELSSESNSAEELEAADNDDDESSLSDSSSSE
jgi:hypothetical protein